MTAFRIRSVRFDLDELNTLAENDIRLKNWPVVYTLNNDEDIYIGETSNVIFRMANHKASPEKARLKEVRLILHKEFNKSACHHLESYLIKYFHADEKYNVLNGNAGISDSDYFEREKYGNYFESIFESFRALKLIRGTRPELENKNIFKYSPFKALSLDQAEAIKGIINILLPTHITSTAKKSVSQKIVVQGGPGTGKTIVAVFLMKLIRDIALSSESEPLETDSIFLIFFNLVIKKS